MISKKIVLHFPKKLVDKPVISKLVKNHNLEFNILKASITPNEEGLLVIELIGEKSDCDKGIEYLKDIGIKIQPLSQDIMRDESRCSHCGVCVPICPVNAFVVDQKTRKVGFDNTKCIACGMCVNVCPAHAMEEHY